METVGVVAQLVETRSFPFLPVVSVGMMPVVVPVQEGLEKGSGENQGGRQRRRNDGALQLPIAGQMVEERFVNRAM